MELFTITLMEKDADLADKLCSLLQNEFNKINEQGQYMTVRYTDNHSYKVIQCVGNIKITALSETMEWVRYRISTALADYILDAKERDLLCRLMADHYYYRDPKEVEKIEKYAVQLLNEGNFVEPSLEFRFARKNKLFQQFYQYLCEHTSINLDGFLQFRLTSYTDELMDVVEHAIDEYIMDQEYQEFISLLRYFVLVQDPKMKEIHVHHSTNGFELMHDDFSPVDMSEIDLFVSDIQDQDIRFEDMIVSTLISASPEKVVIHTEDANHNVVKTITNIFDGRTVICHSCEKCASSKLGAEHGSVSVKKTLRGVDFS
jgi:putative sporulation protein YtxC